MKQAAIYRKLAGMALALPWLPAAVVWAMGGMPGAGAVLAVPAPPLVETVVAHAVNGTADALAARRGIPAGRPIAVRIVDRPHMRAAVDALQPAPRSPEDAREEAALYERLGLPLPRPRQAELESTPSPSPDVSGLYDVAGRWVLIGNWIDLAPARFALSRDVAEALLDRRFDLPRWLAASPVRRPGQGDSDGLLARLSIVEGDATTQALELLDPAGLLPPPRALAELAERTRVAITAEQAGGSAVELGRRLFVELEGLTFVARIRERAPWTAVDGAWRRPPQSTEQVLHPEKYDRHEAPDDVGGRLPVQLRGGWRSTYRDTLGELGVRLFLARAVDDYRADRAAAGWGGDRALLLRRSAAAGSTGDAEPASFAAWITTWDDETDAEDFAVQAASALEALRAVDGQGRQYLLERRRGTVGMLFAAPPEAQAVLSQLMAAAASRPPANRSTRRHAGRVRSR